MITIIPMAGMGSRFSKDGYLLPKPLIPVSGQPMIARVLEGLPESEKVVCLLRPEHIEQYALEQVITGAAPQSIIVPDSATEGQATACHLGIETAEIADDEEIFINACDNGFLYDKKKFDALRARPDVDCILWSFTKDPLLVAKPEAWGWVKLEADRETISDMSVKIPVSDDPFNDHAVVATFWFRRAGDFRAAYAKMVEENYRINNEFYVDSMPIFMKKLGKKSVVFPVDLYVSWGKPADLHLYDLREHEYKAKRGEGYTDTRWKTFFDELKKS